MNSNLSKKQLIANRVAHGWSPCAHLTKAQLLIDQGRMDRADTWKERLRTEHHAVIEQRSWNTQTEFNNNIDKMEELAKLHGLVACYLDLGPHRHVFNPTTEFLEAVRHAGLIAVEYNRTGDR